MQFSISYFPSKKWSAFFILAFLATRMLSQNDAARKDSLRRKFEKDSTHLFRYRKVKPYANLDLRNAYIENSFLSLVGVRFGLTLDNRHVMGLGYYVLNNLELLRSNHIRKYQFEKVNYSTLFYEYVIRDERVFDLLIPLEIGYGSYTATSETRPGEIYTSTMIPTGIGVKAILMPHAWIGIKFGVGYRYVWEQNAQIGMDGAYFTVGFRIDLSRMYRDLRFAELKRVYEKESNPTRSE